MKRTGRLVGLVLGTVLGLTGAGLLLALPGAPVTSASPALTATPSPTPTETATPVFSATLLIAPEPREVRVGEILTVTVDLDVSEGCQYPLLELKLDQPGGEPPIFAHVEPPAGIITGPISLPSVWTFQATKPGTATFVANSFGEQYCGMAWLWHYEQATSEPVEVVPRPYNAYLPAVAHDRITRR